jgi:hypothetical protein
VRYAKKLTPVRLRLMGDTVKFRKYLYRFQVPCSVWVCMQSDQRFERSEIVQMARFFCGLGRRNFYERYFSKFFF